MRSSRRVTSRRVADARPGGALSCAPWIFIVATAALTVTGDVRWFTRSAQPWAPMDPSIPKFETSPSA